MNLKIKEKCIVCGRKAVLDEEGFCSCCDSGGPIELSPPPVPSKKEMLGMLISSCRARKSQLQVKLNEQINILKRDGLDTFEDSLHDVWDRKKELYDLQEEIEDLEIDLMILES